MWCFSCILLYLFPHIFQNYIIYIHVQTVHCVFLLQRVYLHTQTHTQHTLYSQKTHYSFCPPTLIPLLTHKYAKGPLSLYICLHNLPEQRRRTNDIHTPIYSIRRPMRHPGFLKGNHLGSRRLPCHCVDLFT